MRRLTKFAKENPVKARLIITLTHIILPFLAIYFGGLLYDINVSLPATLIPLLTVIFFFGNYLAPFKKDLRIINIVITFVKTLLN